MRIARRTQIPNFMKIGPVRTELFHADGQTDEQTDTTKLTLRTCPHLYRMTGMTSLGEFLLRNGSRRLLSLYRHNLLGLSLLHGLRR